MNRIPDMPRSFSALVIGMLFIAGTAATTAHGSSPIHPGAVELDLDADTDHTGVIEHSTAEEEREDANGEQGVIVLPNWDDDDPPGTAGHGVPDCLIENRFARVDSANPERHFDNRINGGNDRSEDLRILSLRKVPEVPLNWRIVLQVREEDAEHIRVFDETDAPVILPEKAAAFVPSKQGVPHYEHEVTNIVGPPNEFLHYRIEGITPGAKLRISLLAFDGNQERARDRLRVRVAPFMLTPGDQPVRRAITADFRGLAANLRLEVLPGLEVREDHVRREVSRLAPTTLAPPTDNFWQDPFQSGYAVAPGPGEPRTMVLLARLPRNARNFQRSNGKVLIPSRIREDTRKIHWLWPNRTASMAASKDEDLYPALLEPGTGVFELAGVPDRSEADHGGNLEVTWPMPDQGHPLGRAVVGMQMSSTFKEFLREQGIQGPLIEPDLQWLYSRHVDDVAYFLPGRRIAIPSPALAERLLKEHFKKHRDGSIPVFLKGRRILRGKLTGVAASDNWLKLEDSKNDLTAVRPGMYLHIVKGPGRFQTYAIRSADSVSMTVASQAAAMYSFWRSDPIEVPAAGSEYIVVTEPLHDSVGRVLLTTLSGLLDRGERDASGQVRTDNSTIRWFWRANRHANKQIEDKVVPELERLAPSELIRLPVFFREHLDLDRGSVSLPFTPNMVNGQLFGKVFLMPKPFVLPPSSTSSSGEARDPFERAVAEALEGLEARFVDDYFMFHNFTGEVHCAVNVILEPTNTGPYWWESNPPQPARIIHAPLAK